MTTLPLSSSSSSYEKLGAFLRHGVIAQGDSYFYPPPSFVSHPSKDERSKARKKELIGPAIAQS